MNDIMATAGWSRSYNTFEKFYHCDKQIKSDFTHAILKIMRYVCFNHTFKQYTVTPCHDVELIITQRRVCASGVKQLILSVCLASVH